MSSRWKVNSCWVASLDILGFTNLVNINGDTIEIDFIQEDYEKTLDHLKSRCDEYSPGSLEHLWFSDTFVMYTPDDSARSYAVIQQAAKHFIEECLYSSIPIRGAVSVGTFVRSHDGRALMGSAFVDAHIYGDDQDWLGLILTPSAIKKAKSYGLEPSHHDFVFSNEIPMRKYIESEVAAYRFQNGSDNFSSPLLPILKNMKHKAGTAHHAKYDRTIDFIKKHYRKFEST
jgi:hypothetical protein